MGLKEAAVDVCPGDNAYMRATVTTHQVVAIPAEMIGKYCVFMAKTSDVFIRFGTASSVEVDTTAVSTGTPPALTAVATTAHIIVPAGSEVHRRLQAAWTHFAHESADTSGFLLFGVAEGAFGAD